jgi:selenide,water dikinase
MTGSMTGTEKRLTEFSHGAGCGCKLGLDVLTDVLGRLAPPRHPDLLVGTDTGDDAAVWRLDDDRALVVTTDFFTPIVDDARTWGRIAATNAISDVYAMGGSPMIALNLVAWPKDDLPLELLGELLAGASDVARDTGFVIVGGHSIDDPEPKYGLAVIGEVHPDRVLTNAGLQPGHALVLSKPLGVGVVGTAIKRGIAPLDVEHAAVASMTRPNAVAAEAALAAGATGCTDVTGFGLLGHLGRMADASRVDVAVDPTAVPLLPGVRRLAADGCVPGGSQRNLAWAAPRLDPPPTEGDLGPLLLADAQTSGGLLFGAEPDEAHAAAERLHRSGHDAAVIGLVTGPGTGRIRLAPLEGLPGREPGRRARP